VPLLAWHPHRHAGQRAVNREAACYACLCCSSQGDMDMHCIFPRVLQALGSYTQEFIYKLPVGMTPCVPDASVSSNFSIQQGLVFQVIMRTEEITMVSSLRTRWLSYYTLICQTSGHSHRVFVGWQLMYTRGANQEQLHDQGTRGAIGQKPIKGPRTGLHVS
jgi:hypothetical protein